MKIIHILFSILIFSAFCNTNLNPNTRSSILAGRWYPANRENLESTIDNLLKNSETAHSAKQPILLILPHAGYIYSGKVAAVGYNLIKKLSPDIIIIIAPSHYSSFYGCSILPVDYYETPLGKVRIAKDAVKFLLNQNLFQYNRHAHTQEHAIEIHLPFIQRIFENKLLNNIVILPILIGNINSTNAVEISHSIVNAINNKKNPLFIISSDFTHFGERFGYLPFNSQDRNTIKQKIKQLDHGAIDRILAKDIKGFTEYIKKTEATICGRNAIMVALSMPINNFKARLAAYDTSGNITGDFNNSVSYSAIVVSGTIEKNAMKHGNSKNSDFNLSQDDKKFLLNLARNNIESLLYKNKTIKIKKQNVPKNCKKMAGAFITLKKKGRLRGCIGYVMGIKPLYRQL